MTESTTKQTSSELDLFHPAAREWFTAVFPGATRPQRLGWPPIARGESTLILAPTGSGKTLAAFLWCINRLMFSPPTAKSERCRVVYVSPIKALAVDVERNLRAPLVGIAQAARRQGLTYHEPSIAIRTGDTPPAERARFLRHPSDILITTPESLYLLLTSQARELLRSVEVVIVDEIHALVPTKRGTHLMLSVERLEHLAGRPLQRIGLSATQRPLDEVARFLGGTEPRTPSTGGAESTSASRHHAADPGGTETALDEFEAGSEKPHHRVVSVIDASEPKQLSLRVEVPVEDMSSFSELDPLPSGPAEQGPTQRSIWSAIHPKLLEHVRAHRSTLIFVNNRRLAERITGAVNELAGETLLRAHHGSVSLDQRKDIEDRLKRGAIRGLVATSSLELGIDMGAVDLVIQIECPPSVASGMQRVGRASHQAGAISNGILFPKYRADLLASAAVTRAMYEGHVEAARYPRNALDVLAQHIVAIVSFDAWTVETLLALVRRAAPYAGLTRATFEGVLDMLAGRYPSDDFAELRPRIVRDRVSNRISARQGARRVAIVNGGTIPDRGLYGVFLSGAARGARVGELDEEMVFESRAGDTIVLGASTWRIQEITHDRVVVSPAPGEPGKMPFWKGDGPGRPAEFGKKIGELTRELLALPRPVAFAKLVQAHSLDASAAENLLRFLEDQAVATTHVPSDRDVVIEICRDELGDRRVCVLSPFGSRVHAPWCMAATAKLRAERAIEVESMWTDDGFVLRIPDGDAPILAEQLVPSPAEFHELVMRQLGSTSLFAAKFREAAGRALLLPRRRPGLRSPLWQQRKRAADLLAVAARFSSFPILLEAYRECLRDAFDVPAAVELLAAIQRGAIRVTTLETDKPSPFAASLLFTYVANYIYDGDAPLAERRAQALAIDPSQLQEILGDTDLRELLDQAAIDEVAARLQSLDEDYQARHVDGLHDLLLKLGDLSESELAARSANPEVAATIGELVATRRAVRVRIAAELRFIPAEYAARYRDALGTPLPPGLADGFLEATEDPLGELARRYARTHGPFTAQEVATRYALQPSAVSTVLHALHGRGKLLQGEFRPRGQQEEWCEPEVLQQIRRKSLARLRKEVEPVEQRIFARFITRWHGLTARRRSMDALLDAVETLQGAALLASELEREILPARVADYQPGDLDTVVAAGEVVWVGLERVGERDGRIALYLADGLLTLRPPAALLDEPRPLSEKAQRVVEFLGKNGASFFPSIYAALGGGYHGETRDALWELVWMGTITNDTLHPLRELLRPPDLKRERLEDRDVRPGSPEYLRRLRSRKAGGGPAQGRWSLVQANVTTPLSVTEWSANFAQQLLTRNGIVMRETAAAENVPRGYSTVYPALKTMEESGRIRRGMFVAGMGAAQFATPAAVDLLRSMRGEPQTPESVFLAASDPANPYGSLLPWPRDEETAGDSGSPAMSRTSGAGVVLIDGALSAFVRRRNPALRLFLPENEPERTRSAAELAKKLAELALRWQGRRSGLLISTINAGPAKDHFVARFLEEVGFVHTALGFQMRRVARVLSTEQLDLNDALAEGDREFPESA